MPRGEQSLPEGREEDPPGRGCSERGRRQASCPGAQADVRGRGLCGAEESHDHSYNYSLVWQWGSPLGTRPPRLTPSPSKQSPCILTCPGPHGQDSRPIPCPFTCPWSLAGNELRGLSLIAESVLPSRTGSALVRPSTHHPGAPLMAWPPPPSVLHLSQDSRTFQT